MRPGCAPEIRQLTVSVPALPSEYSILRIASPAVLPGMFGLDASARSQRTSPVTVYVPLPVTALPAFRVSQFPPPAPPLKVPPPPPEPPTSPFLEQISSNPPPPAPALKQKTPTPCGPARVAAPTPPENSSPR